jgi:hypothetical protein
MIHDQERTGKGETGSSDEAGDDSVGNAGCSDVSGTLGGENGRRNEGGEKEDEDESEKSLLDTDRREGFNATRSEQGVGEETEAKYGRDSAAKKVEPTWV